LLKYSSNGLLASEFFSKKEANNTSYKKDDVSDKRLQAIESSLNKIFGDKEEKKSDSTENYNSNRDEVLSVLKDIKKDTQQLVESSRNKARKNRFSRTSVVKEKRNKSANESATNGESDKNNSSKDLEFGSKVVESIKDIEQNDIYVKSALEVKDKYDKAKSILSVKDKLLEKISLSKESSREKENKSESSEKTQEKSSSKKEVSSERYDKLKQIQSSREKENKSESTEKTQELLEKIADKKEDGSKSVESSGMSLLTKIKLAVASLALAFVVWKKYGKQIKEKVGEFITSFKEKISSKIEAFKEKVSSVFSSIVSSVKELKEKVTNFFTEKITKTKEKVKEVYKDTVSGIKGFFGFDDDKKQIKKETKKKQKKDSNGFLSAVSSLLFSKESKNETQSRNKEVSKTRVQSPAILQSKTKTVEARKSITDSTKSTKSTTNNTVNTKLDNSKQVLQKKEIIQKDKNYSSQFSDDSDFKNKLLKLLKNIDDNTSSSDTSVTVEPSKEVNKW